MKSATDRLIAGSMAFIGASILGLLVAIALSRSRSSVDRPPAHPIPSPKQVPFGNVQVKEPRDMLKLVASEPDSMTRNIWRVRSVEDVKDGMLGIIEHHLLMNDVPTNSLKTSFQGFPPDSVMLKPLHEWKPPKLPLIVSDDFNVPEKRLDEVLDAVCKEYSIKWRLDGNVIVFDFCATPLDSKVRGDSD